MDIHKAVLKLQVFVVVLAIIRFELLDATTTTNHRPSNPPIHPTDPLYRFHYLTQKSEEHKTSEKLSNGDNKTNSYKAAEQKGDLRVINHTTDDSSRFNPNANVQVGVTPMRGIAFTGSTLMPPFGGLHNNFYRNGVSSPLRNHKPVREMNPIVVKSPPLLALPQALSPTRQGNLAPEFSQQPYAFYRESRNDSSTVQGADILNSIRQLVQTNTTYTNITAAGKSETSALENFEMKSALYATTPSALPATVTPTVINTENQSFDLQSLSYLERGGLKSVNNNIRPTTENGLSNRNLFHLPPPNGVNQLQKMDIPSSIMEILNQNKEQTYTADSGNVLYAMPPPNTFTDVNILRPSSGISDNLMKVTESKMNYSLPGPKDRTNMFFPQRPMRLIGLNPMFVDNVQLQSIAENSTVPQFHWESLSNVQYVAPIPLHAGTLPFGPIWPFHNVPRSVNELPNSEIPFINPQPLLNSVAISAPIIPQSLPGTEMKSSDAKADGKPIPSPFLLCNDCVMPSNYVTYPIVRIPTSASASAPLPASSTLPLLNSIPAPSPNLAAVAQSNSNGNGQKAPCTNNAAGSAPLWASYSPSFPAAYILLPTPILKNMINDTRTLSAKIFT